MATTTTINLATTTYYGAFATNKIHLMNAKHAERIIAARNSKPEYVDPAGDSSEHNFDAYTAYLNSPEYRAYEREYRAALASARVVCIQRQTRVYATPQSTPLDPNALPKGMCLKCLSHIVS